MEFDLSRPQHVRLYLQGLDRRKYAKRCFSTGTRSWKTDWASFNDSCNYLHTCIDRGFNSIGANTSNSYYQKWKSGTENAYDIAAALSGMSAVKSLTKTAPKLINIEMNFIKNEIPSFSKNTGPSNGFLGHKGWELKNPMYQDSKNMSTSIYNRDYSAHAIDQMQNRGIPPSAVENTIANGTPSTGKVKGTSYYYCTENDMFAVTNEKTGKVITSGFGEIR